MPEHASRTLVEGIRPGRFRGPFAASTAYSLRDIITYSGSTYTSKAAFTSGSAFVLADWDPLPGAAVANNATDVVRGATDRFYRTIAVTLRYTDGQWKLVSEAENRPQNVDGVDSTSSTVTVDYSSIGGTRVGSVVATPNEVMLSSGIRVTTDASPAETKLNLFQSKRMSDFAYWNGTAWTLGKGLKSPFTLSGLDGTVTDFAAAVLATADLVAHYRFTDTSGAVLTDSSGNARDGAIVSTGHTFGVTGGLAHEAAPKAIKTAAGGTNAFSFALNTWMTQAAFTVEWFGKLDPAATVVFRDATQTSTSSYSVSYSSANGGRVSFRTGTTTSVTTAYPWASLNDGRFHHVVMTKDAANVSLYIDGVLIHAITNASAQAIASPWYVGKTGQNGSAVTSQVVTMDELAFYSRALTPAEVTAHNYAALDPGLLTVSHESAGDTDLSAISLTSQSVTAQPIISSAVGAIRPTSFDIAFYNGTTQVQGANTGMRVGISRAIAERPINPNALSIPRFASGSDYPSAVLSDNPQSYWRLKEAAGITAISDLAGTNDGVTEAGITMGVAGLLTRDVSTAAQFDGAQGKITFENPNLTGSLSLECWFKCTGVGSVGNTAAATLFGWQNLPSARRIIVNATTGTVTVNGGSATLDAVNAAPPNSVHHLVFTWDQAVERLYVDGALVDSDVALSGIAIIQPLILGSYAPISTNYSFKGVMDEVAVYDKALSLAQIIKHYAVGLDTVLKYEASSEAQISLYGLLEVGAPPPPAPETPPALPEKTPYPPGDLGAGVYAQVPLNTTRAMIGSEAGWVKRALPTDVAARNTILVNGHNGYVGATSDNWRRSLCTQMGLDPDTPQTQAVTNYITGHTDGQLWLRPGELIYVVPDNQPLIPFTDTDVSVAGWAAGFNAIVAAMGGLPMPSDARPHSTADRYTFVWQPSKDRAISIYGHKTNDPARTTMTLTASPNTGGFFFKMLYMDNATTFLTEYTGQTYIPYNATTAQVISILQQSKNPSGVLFGATRPGGYGPSVVASGGPLNAAPIELTFPLAEGMRPVALVITDNFMNSGTCTFTYHNAGPYNTGRLCSMVSPSDDGIVVGGQSVFSGGPFINRTDGSGLKWMDSRWMATATGIDFFGLVPSSEEFAAAQASGGNLGHVLAMSIGKAQKAPFSAVYPATRADGLQNTVDGSFMPEGARICLPPDVDLSGVIPEFLPIARTLRDYGCIVIDKTGGGSEIILRRNTMPNADGTQIPSFWPDILPLYKTTSNAAHRYMKSIPWHKCQVIDPNWNA